jgi:hydrogenase 3 maturation protease
VRDLKNYLRGRVIILGIGNRFKADDGFGSIFAERLKKYENQNLKIIDCEEVPENYINEIMGFKPERIIIFDAVYVQNKLPGEIIILEEKEIKGGGFSTHAGSLSSLFKLLRISGLNFEVFLIGVIPKNVEISEGLSFEVEEAIDKILSSFH